jgi:hypothetical protein
MTDEVSGMEPHLIAHIHSLELPWVEKYRPLDLEQVVSQRDITQTLETFIHKV